MSNNSIQNLSNLINEYFILKQQSGGNVEYLYHGTSFFYIDYIKINGLQGKYPDELFNKINKFWPHIKKSNTNTKALAYVPGFIERNTKDNYQISLTPKLEIAKEYAGGARKIGEGPTYFTYALGEYLVNKESNDLLDDMRNFYNILNDALRYPPLILAIKVNKFEQLKNITIKEDMWELSISFSISPDKLYIISEDGPIKLLSPEGNEYIQNTKIQFDKSEKERKKEQEQEQEKLKDWTEDKSLEGNYKYFMMVKNTYMIKVVYDIFKNEYMRILVDNPEILIDITISVELIKRKIVMVTNIKKNLEINDELKEKLNYIINVMLEYTGEKKENYKAEIKKIIDWIKF